jgi:hypothetical protein
VGLHLSQERTRRPAHGSWPAPPPTPLSTPPRRAVNAQHLLGVGTKAVDGEAGPLILEDQPNLERIVTIGVQYGIEILPPIAQRSRV